MRRFVYTAPNACWQVVQQVLVTTRYDNITATDLEGEILIEHTRPAPGVG